MERSFRVALATRAVLLLIFASRGVRDASRECTGVKWKISMDQFFVQMKQILLLVSHGVYYTKYSYLLMHPIFTNNLNHSELEFSASMTCDDVCDWLKQNNLSDKDIISFRSESRAKIFSWINAITMAEQEVDGETLLELSSSTDFEDLLQCSFTLGAKTKLKKLMAAVSKGPSGRRIPWLVINLFCLLWLWLSLVLVTQRRRKLTSIKMFWDLRAHWRNLASELNITIGDCEVINSIVIMIVQV